MERHMESAIVMREPRRRGLFRLLPAAWGIAAAMLLLPGSCGKGKTDTGGGQSGGQAGGQAGGGSSKAEGGPNQQKQEQDEGQGTGKASLLPRETERLKEALVSLKNGLMYNDPGAFEDGFSTAEALKSVVTDVKGKAAWAAMEKEAGGDFIEFKKAYRARIRALFDGLRLKGGSCRLDEAQWKAMAEAGRPAVMLFADTFANPLGRNYVVLLAGFPDKDGMAGLLRFRALPHQNIRKWYLAGGETLDSVARLTDKERESVREALLLIHAGQEAYRGSRASDADGTEPASTVSWKQSPAWHPRPRIPTGLSRPGCPLNCAKSR